MQILLEGAYLNFDSVSVGDAWLVACYYHQSTHSVSINLNSNVTETSASNDVLNWATMASVMAIAATVRIAVIALLDTTKSLAQ